MVLPKSDAVRPPTIYDVARVAGVSHQTVSRFLKGETGIKGSTRERVESAVAELGYRPNPTARALATNRSLRIGALVYELQELGPSQIAQGAADQAREAGYLLDIVSLDPEDGEAIAHAITLLDEQNLAGILAMAPTRRLLDALQSANFRVPVVIDTEPVYTGESQTESLNTLGTRLALEHLFALGHERIFPLSGPQEWISAGNRLLTYQRILRERNLPVFESINGNWTAASGYSAALRMPRDAGITAVLVGNDQMAMGALRAFSELGLRIPGEVSVVGFDDIPEAEFTIPPLTTVKLNFAEQGRTSIEQLVAKIENRPSPTSVEASTVSLIVRASTGPVTPGLAP